MGEVKRQSVSLERWKLNSPQQMCNCLVELVAKGYTGSIQVGKNPDDIMVWQIELEGPHRLAPVGALLGQVIVLVGSRLESLTNEQYRDIYGGDD